MTESPASVDELLARLDKTSIPEDHSELEFYLEASTEAAEGWKNTGPIMVRTVTEQLWTNPSRRLIVSHRPVVSVTTATHIDGTVYVTADLEVDQQAGIIGALDWWLLSGGYTVVYQAGRNPVPASLKMAVLLIAEHNWRAKQGPRTRAFRGQGAQAATGEEMARAPNGFLIPRIAAGYLRSESDPFQVG
jgi:hypothetical protein